MTTTAAMHGSTSITSLRIHVQRIEPHMNYLVERLNAGERLEDVAQDTALRAGVTPGQVILVLRAILQSQQSS